MRKREYYENHEFTGTEQYHYAGIFRKVIATDGAIDTLQKFECFWLHDLVAPEIMKFQDQENFITVLAHPEDLKVILDDGNGNVLWKKKLDYTDLKRDLKFFVVYNGNGQWVMMLPSEY